MPTPARVVVCPQGPGPLRIEEVDLPDPGPHQVVVKQLASGVCHSQLHQMHGPGRSSNCSATSRRASCSPPAPR